MVTIDHITTHKIVNFDGSAFIGGIKRNETDDKVQAFICGVTPDGKIGWYKDYLLQLDSGVNDSHTRLAAITVIPGGCLFILNGYKEETGEMINQLITLDESGEEKLSKRLLISDYPRSINYIEQTNAIFTTFKGEEFNQNIFLSNDLIISYYNILGDLQWQQRYGYKGDIIDVNTVSDGFIISGNYNEIKGIDGKMVRAGGTGMTKLFQLKVNPNGTIANLKTIESTGPYFGNKTYKVSDDCINVLGSKGPYVGLSQLDKNPNTFVHIITNNKLEVLSKSIQ